MKTSVCQMTVVNDVEPLSGPSAGECAGNSLTQKVITMSLKSWMRTKMLQMLVYEL